VEDWLKRLSASLAARAIAAIFSVYVLAATGAIYASWDYLKAAPWPLQALAALFVGWIVLWLIILVSQYLATPRVRGAAPRSVLWYKLPIRRVSWDLEGYLGYGRLQERPLAVFVFNAHYKINWGEGIVPKKAYIECKRTGAYFDALTDPGNNYVKAEDAKFISRGRWHSCQVSFGEMPPEEFLKKLGGFWFVFVYDNDERFSRFFSEGELEAYLDRARKQMA